MGHVSSVLQGLKDSLPERATPVTSELLMQIALGRHHCAHFDSDPPTEAAEHGLSAVCCTAVPVCTVSLCYLGHQYLLSTAISP